MKQKSFVVGLLINSAASLKVKDVEKDFMDPEI